MESAGGGWTLVATINDENIHQDCVPDDVWFSNSARSVKEPYSKCLSIQEKM